MKRNFLYHLFIIVFISLNIYAQAGYEEFNCYIDDSNFNEQSFSDGVVAQPAIEGSADLAILLCVENGQDKTVTFINKHIRK